MSKKSIYAILLSIITALSFIKICDKVFAMELPSVYEEKIYCNVTIDEDFDGSNVIVLLDKSISGINKIHNKDFFGNIDIESIEDLTFMPQDAIDVIDVDKFRQILLLKLPQDNKEIVLQTIKQIEKIDGVKYVGPDICLEAEKNPDDTLYSTEYDARWGLEKIHAPEAWNFTTGSNKIRVGIIDSGIGDVYNGQIMHPDLEKNVNAWNENLIGGDFTIDFGGGQPSLTLNSDMDGHGTHIAGIVGAVGNNNIGVCGVNREVSLVPMQVSNERGTHDLACIRAIQYATRVWNTDKRIHILNFSLKIAGRPELKQAIELYPGLFVSAAGNSNLDLDAGSTDFYPAKYGSELSNMIVVGKSNKYDERGRNSNYGAKTVNIYAPGDDIISTFPESLYGQVLDGVTHVSRGYAKMSGTSMAAPFVAGVAALLLSKDSNLSAEELKKYILQSADDIEISTPTGERQTVKRLNALQAINMVVNATPYYVTINNGTATIVGIKNDERGKPMLSGKITIPESVVTYSVTAIGDNAFRNQSAVTGVTILNNVKSIGDYAFAWSGLSSITIPSSVKSIGDYAFAGIGLSSITIPSSVTTLGKGVFAGCSKLTNATFAEPCQIKSLGANLFNTSGLTGIDIPSSVEDIEESAFAGCSNLVSVNFNLCYNLKNIFSYAFRNTGLKHILIPPSVEAIWSSAFEECSNLTQIYFSPGNLLYIGDYAFMGSGLKSFKVPNSVTTLGEYIFYNCTDLKTVTFEPNGKLTSIGYHVFKDSYITSIEIPEFITSIDGFAFDGCRDLTTITFEPGSKLETISGFAFQNSGLTDIKLPENLINISDWAFCNCKNLKSIIIPSSVERIGKDAFMECTALKTVELQRPSYMGITIFGSNALGDNNLPYYPKLSYILVPDYESAKAYKAANPVFEDIIQYKFTYTLQDDGTYSIGKGTFNYGETLTIPSTYNGKAITKIEDSAFSGCTELKSITIPNSVKSIGNFAFSGCTGLTSITIPSGVTSVASKAFYNCSNLTSITVNSANKIYKSDSNCIIQKSDNTLVLGCKASIIPSYVTAIGAYAFSCGGLINITIPSGIQNIGAYAFYGCELYYVEFIRHSSSGISGYSAYMLAGAADIQYIYVPEDSYKNYYNRFVVGSSDVYPITYKGKISKGSYFDCVLLDDGTCAIIKGRNSLVEHVQIPRTFNGQYITQILAGAFDNYRNLKTLTISSYVTTIEDNFGNSGNVTIYTEAGSTSGWQLSSKCHVVWNCMLDWKDNEKYEYGIVCVVAIANPQVNIEDPYMYAVEFAGWRDSQGNLYSSNELYVLPKNTLLYAVWDYRPVVI